MAKFKVGDKVKIVDRINLDFGKTGVITAYHGYGQYQISLDINGGLRGVSEREIVPNSVGNRSFACNDAYVDGMTAKDLDDALESLENIIDDGDVMPSDKRSLIAYKKAAVRLGKLRDWQYVAKRMGINSFSNSCRNSVVANAISAVCNSILKMVYKGEATVYYSNDKYDMKFLHEAEAKGLKYGDRIGGHVLQTEATISVDTNTKKRKVDFVKFFEYGGKVVAIWNNGKWQMKPNGVSGLNEALVSIKSKANATLNSKDIVANAIAWKARNAVYSLGHKFEKGDDVAFKGNTSYKGKVVDAEVHGNHGTFYIVKWNDGKTYRVTESDLIKNSTVTNADVKDSNGNALKDGDYVIPTLGSFKCKRVKILSIHSRANIYIQDASGSVKIIDGQYLVKA